MKRLSADIHRRIGNFDLNMLIESDAGRIGMLGASGSGKSMTLRSIAGIETVDSGHIEVDGRVLFDSASRTNLKPQKRNVGYMFQNYALFPTMTVLQNVMCGLNDNKAEKVAKAEAMLARFRMTGHAYKLPGELSGGQQQRVALARIMVTEPSLILLDEPFSALDGYLKEQMQEEMMEMLEDYPGQVIMVSHNRDELYRFSEDLFIVSNGKVIRYGSKDDVLRDPGSEEAANLTGSVLRKTYPTAERLASDMDFYDVISELNINLENRLFVVCDGAHAGEKMIVSGGEIIWMSNETGFFAGHGKEAMAAEDGKIAEIRSERVYAELLGNEKKMVICGAGHVSMPVIRIAKMMGFRVTVIDDRELFVQNALDNGADEGVCSGFEEALADIPGDPDTFFIIVTSGHLSDSECLLSIVKTPYAYIGMIGSRRKVGMVKQLLADSGVPQDVIDSVHTPIGLDIGAETPEEIAVAIMAEIIEVKNKTRKSTGIPAEIMKALLSDDRGDAVLATIVSKKGSSPRSPGSRMLIMEDGSIVGTIGGGKGEARVIERAAELLAANKNGPQQPVMVYVDMTGQEVLDEGMICGGAIEVLLEIL